MSRPAHAFLLTTLGITASIAHAAHPVTPLKLEQRDANGTLVAPGSVVSGNTIRLTASSSDQTCDSTTANYWLEIELRPLGTAFTGTPTHTSAAMAKPNCNEVQYPLTAITLTPGQYHWRVREKVKTSTSGWLAFNSGNLAFTLANGPYASVSPNPVQLGFVRVGATSDSQTVELSNLGNANLEVASAQITAPFSLVTSPTLPATVPPGQKLSFTVDVTPSVVGPVTGSLSIPSNDSQSPTVVTLNANGAVPQLALETTALAFGPVGINSAPATQTLKVSNAGQVPLTLSQAVTTGPFSITPAASVVIAGGQQALFTVSFAPTSQGPHNATLTLTSDDASSPHTVSLSGEGIAPQLSLAPTSFDFGEVRVGQTSAPTTINTSNPGTGTLTVSAATVTGPFTLTGLAPNTTLAAAASGSFIVSFAPTAPGPVTGSISVTSNDAASPTVLTLQGMARAPAMTVSPPSHNFGAVDVGNSQDLMLTVTNSGDAPLSFTAYAFTGGHSGDFSLLTPPSLPTVLAPAATLPLTVRFVPSNLGNRTTQLVLQSDRYPSGPLLIPLSGLGAGSRIALSTNQLSYGPVNVGATPASQTVTVSNGGSTPLDVTAVSFSGAASSDFATTTPLPLTVGPGSTGSLEVSFAPSGAGVRSAVATVQSNDPLKPGANLSLLGTGIAPHLRLTPMQLDFGTVRSGFGAIKSVTLVNAGNGPLTLTAAQLVGPQAARFTLGPISLPQTLAPGALTAVQVTFAPTAVGISVANLEIASDDPLSPTSSLVLVGAGASPKLLVSAPKLDFGAQQVSRPSEPRTLWLMNKGSAAVNITSVGLTGSHALDFTPSGVTTPLTIGPGERTALSVTLTPSAVAPHTAQLVLNSDDLTASTIQVALEGVGVSKLISVSQSQLGFGMVPVGSQSPTKELTLTNLSGEVLLANAAVLEGAQAEDFVVDTRAGTIGPQGTTSVQVFYRPRLAGNSSAVAVLRTTDPRVAPVQVALSGQGVSTVFSANPTEVAFDPVEAGASSEPVSITLTNHIDQPLRFKEIVSTHESFVVNASALSSIDPGATATVSVTFAPTSELGQLQGELQFTLEGGEAPELRVSLSGTALRQGAQGCGCGAGGGSPWFLLSLLLLGLGRRGGR